MNGKMRKTLFLVSAVVLLIGLSQCRKPVLPDYAGGGVRTVTFVTDGGGSKGEFVQDKVNDLIKYKWDYSDKMYVYASETGSFDAGNGKYCGFLIVKDVVGNYTATFNGKIPMPYTTGKVRFIHYGKDVTVDDETGVASVSFREQNGKLSAKAGGKASDYTISSKIVAVYDADYNESCLFKLKENETMKIQFAIVKMSFSGFTGTDIMVSGLPANKIEVTAKGEVRYANNGTLSLLKNAIASSGYYVVFVNETNEVEHRFSGEKETVVWKKRFYDGRYYHGATSDAPCVITGEVVIPDNVLAGEFTVDASETKVCFANGNVQYQASTKTWRFAEHQYDFVGNSSYGTVYAGGTKCDNSEISSTYEGWIDLFGWATSGLKYNESFTHLQPYETGETSSSYKAYDSSVKNLYDDPGRTADWGRNFDDEWFTLSKDQYNYLLKTRTVQFVDATGTVHDGFRYSVVKISDVLGASSTNDDVSGVLLFPDVFRWTSDMGVMPKKMALVILKVIQQNSLRR
ncbi:MAG: hypothetical protein MJZ78_08080 [Bacteroidales bacterium]|nr:hypothetical protein [Bacteroidales bacterium]